MKVITFPAPPTIAGKTVYDGCVLVARWKANDALTSFRWHRYNGCWYSPGSEEKYSTSTIMNDLIHLALFYDPDPEEE